MITIKLGQSGNGEKTFLWNPINVSLKTAHLAAIIAVSDYAGFPPKARAILKALPVKFFLSFPGGMTIKGEKKDWALLTQVTNKIYSLVNEEMEEWEK